MFKKILIANRGEIAVRVMNSATKMGIATVAIYAKPDADAYHRQKAGEAYLLQGDDLLSTYLNIHQIIEIAKMSGSDAIHPGYGFLSENPDFVKACNENGIVFIGPDAESMLLMGNKIESRKFAKENGIPITEGITGTPEELLARAETIALPLLVKAAAGGGGKGMRIVRDYKSLKDTLESTSREAATYFGNPDIYIEKYIEEPRHIEVQVLGDHHGHVVHLFERECSIQRRYQKIIEESPSPTLDENTRKKICEAAVTIAGKTHYKNAGTVEFLVDKNLNYYFLEMNTRVQVEHPVTEMVTGIDIVQNQIKIASGIPLEISQEDVKQEGHAIECRIYAEEPENNFMPSPGEMTFYQEPEGENIRLDTSTHRAMQVYSLFDPMISKLICKGKNRTQAINHMYSALGTYHIHGIKTNINYLRYILKDPDYASNNISTSFCDTHHDHYLSTTAEQAALANAHIPVIAFLAYDFNYRKNHEAPLSVWEQIGFWRQHMELTVKCNGAEYPVEIRSKFNTDIHFVVDGQEYKTKIIALSENRIKLQVNGSTQKIIVSKNQKNTGYVSYGHSIFELVRGDTLSGEKYRSAGSAGGGQNKVVAPMPGKVIKIKTSQGAKVKKNDVLLIVEAMKMENNLVAPYDGTVKDILVKEGDMVDRDIELVILEKKSSKNVKE